MNGKIDNLSNKIPIFSQYEYLFQKISISFLSILFKKNGNVILNENISFEIVSLRMKRPGHLNHE